MYSIDIYIHTELDDTSVKNTVLYMQVTVFIFQVIKFWIFCRCTSR